jgi:carbonic anhydrase
MSTIDETIQHNHSYVKSFELGHLPVPPARKLAVVACMDARIMVEHMLGLKTGDAHIIRNAGGIVSEDALRSLIISHYLLGTQEFMVINHTDCGMLTFTDEELKSRMQAVHHTSSVSPAAFHAFRDLEQNVREQVAKIKSHPWTPKDVPVRGFVYDVKTGKLNEVT